MAKKKTTKEIPFVPQFTPQTPDFSVPYAQRAQLPIGNVKASGTGANSASGGISGTVPEGKIWILLSATFDAGTTTSTVRRCNLSIGGTTVNFSGSDWDNSLANTTGFSHVKFPQSFALSAGDSISLFIQLSAVGFWACQFTYIEIDILKATV